MKLLKTKNTNFKLRYIALFAVLFAYILVIPVSVFAAEKSEAQKACDQNQYKENGAEIDACIIGYNAGKAHKNRDTTCGSYGPKAKEACYFGFGKGACAIDNPNDTDLQKCLNANPIIEAVRMVVNFLSAGVGIIITGSIIWGGVQFAMAGNNPQAVTAAKKRIQDALIALMAFFFIFAFLQWIIPGGLINGIFQ